MRLKIHFSEGQRFSPQFSDTDQIIKLDFGEHVGGIVDYWKGEYVFTPSLDGQEYATKGKTMSDNLVIDPIPYAEVSNPRGGYTVNIGG